MVLHQSISEKQILPYEVSPSYTLSLGSSLKKKNRREVKQLYSFSPLFPGSLTNYYQSCRKEGRKTRTQTGPIHSGVSESAKQKELKTERQ